MLWAILNKSWRQRPTIHQLYGHLPPITKTIQVRRSRHARHCWRSKDELISDVLLWTPHMAKEKQDDQLELTYSSYMRTQDVTMKTCQWRERFRDICAGGTTWWWWWYDLTWDWTQVSRAISEHSNHHANVRYGYKYSHHIDNNTSILNHYHHIVLPARISQTLSKPVSIIHRSREVFTTISCISRELLNVGSSWSFGPLLFHKKGSTRVYRLWVRT